MVIYQYNNQEYKSEYKLLNDLIEDGLVKTVLDYDDPRGIIEYYFLAEDYDSYWLDYQISDLWEFLMRFENQLGITSKYVED